MIELLKPLEDLTNTITSDNGKEYAEYGQIVDDCLQADVYFARPYSSWEQAVN